MNKKNNSVSIEELIKNEISAVEVNDKLTKLEKERARDKKIIAEYKEREKATARALVLYERKIKYLKETLIEDVLSVAKKLNDAKPELENMAEKVTGQDISDEIIGVADNLEIYENLLYEICNKMEANAAMTKKDRAFIANKPIEEENLANDANSRFDRLKQEFAQKIGSSVNRKRGRPKKSEQSIVADIGLGKKVEAKVKERGEVEDKLNDIFYNAPTAKGVQSAIPQTADSMFDFDEALNPNVSLKDIMADLMSDEGDDEIKTYSDESLAGLKPAEEKITKEINVIQSKPQAESIEAGFIHIPTMRKANPVVMDSVAPKKPIAKPSFERRFMSIQELVKESKE